MLGKRIVVIAFQGDSVLDNEPLEGTIIGESKSKTWPGSIALSVQLELESQDKLRPHTADPTAILVDLDGTPPERLPGMRGYEGGAFVRLYGRASVGDSEFGRYLGRGEAVEDRAQPPISFPPSAFHNDALRVVELAKKDFGADLAFDLRGLLEGAKVVARVGWGGASDPTQKGRLIFMWGAFFGECLIAQYGGKWSRNPAGRDVVLLSRGDLAPLTVVPFSLFEKLAMKGDFRLARDWVIRLGSAIQSPEHSPQPIE